MPALALLPRILAESALPCYYFGVNRNNAVRRARAIDDIFRALSDPTRREILRLLRSGDLAAGHIAARFPLAKSTLSGHLKLLRESGLVVTERNGTTLVYSLNMGAHEDVIAAVFALMRVGEPRGARVSQEVGHAAHLAD